MKNVLLFSLLFFFISTFAYNAVPVGRDNNELYYKIGGGSDFALPPVSDTDRISLDSSTNLGLGYNCSSFNPAIAILNSINNLRDSANNLTRDVILNATGSIIMLPGYELAKRNPTLYALLNNYLLSSHNELKVTTKDCQLIKEQIARGQNPYQDWGVIAVNDQWKRKLSLTATSNDVDINKARKDINRTSGDAGVPWVSGQALQESDGSLHAGGKGQPPVHVIADTVKAGYNTLLNRNLQDDSPAPSGNSSMGLKNAFPQPLAAVSWITNVVGDQRISTCNDDSCKSKQGTVIGHGLLPNMTSCRQDKDNCVQGIRDYLAKLVTGSEPITKENLTKVSAEGIFISPEVITAIRTNTQQSIVIQKLAQEVAMQRIIDKAFIAKNILSTGAQVPVIAANHPAQVVINRAIERIDNEIRSLVFEKQIRKQMMPDTIFEILNYSNQQEKKVARIAPVFAESPLMENGAVKGGKK